MSKFARHMARPVTLTIERDGTKDDFIIKPMPFKYMPELFRLLKLLNKVPFAELDKLPPEESTRKLLDVMPQETFELMVELIHKTLEISYPEISQDDRDAFASAHPFEILNAMLEANSYGNTKK